MRVHLIALAALAGVLTGCSATPESAVPAATTSSTTAPANLEPDRTAVQPADPDDVDAIVELVTVLFDGSNADAAYKTSLVDGPSLAAEITASREQHPWRETMTGTVVDVNVPDGCPATAPEPCALVRYELAFTGDAAPDRPYRFAGYVVNVDGTWKMSRTSFCELLQFGGQPCGT